VNLEVDGGDVRFFPKGNYAALAQLMKEALGEPARRSDSAELLAQSERRLLRNGEAIWTSIQGAISTRRRRQAC
jgi:hypothetical protein